MLSSIRIGISFARWGAVAWLCAVAAFAAAPADAEPRVALVIGNSSYGDLGTLPNPVNDAKLIASTLKQVGFTVIEVEDADQQAMKRAIVDFGDKLSTAGAGATGLFFYAGHGLQYGGENYLIPVHATLRKESDVDVEAVPVDLVLKQMDFAQSAVNIVILDACRNNPLSTSGRGVSRGLAEIKTKPIGSFISYSTSPGEVAEDGNGADSPYSEALAKAILKPGQDLAEVFRDVRKSVIKATNQKQVPWDSWSLTDPYYFIPPTGQQGLPMPGDPGNPPGASAPAQIASIDPKVLDNNYWEGIKDSKDPADYQSYLDQFPNGVYAKLAANRLKAMGAGTSSGAQAPEPDTGSDRAVPAAPAEGAPAAPIVFTASDQLLYTKAKTPLYTAPDETSPVLSDALGGLAIRAAGRSPDGKWWQLSLPNGRIAYALSADMDERPDAPAPQVADAGGSQSASTGDQPAQDPVAKQYFDLGAALFDQGDFKGARAAFDQAATRDPKDAQAVLKRGRAALAMGDLDPALADFDHAVELDPNAIEAHGLRILARLETGDAAGAAKNADAVQQIEPTFWSATATAAYYLAGRLPDAEAMAQRVAEDNSEDARSWIWQAIVMRAEGRDGEAVDLLQSSIDFIGNRDWPVPVIEWMQGKRTPDRLMVAAKTGDPATQLRQICEADFFLGEAAYTAGDRAGAEKLLDQAAEAKAPDLLAYAAAKALLAKMARE